METTSRGQIITLKAIMERKNTLLANPSKLLYKKPFTRGVNEEFIRIYRQDILDEDKLIAEIPSYTGRTISQAQYLLELDPSSHAIMFNDDLPRLSSNPNASWDEANTYRASFAIQRQILSQHSEYVNTNGMKLILLNQEPTPEIHKTFISIKEEWVSRNMNIYKKRLYDEQKSVGDASLLYYFNAAGVLKCRVLSYKKGYQLIPQYDENGDMLLISVYYKSNGKLRLDTYDETTLYKFTYEDGKEWQLTSSEKHGFSQIPLIYIRGEVAWEAGQGLIDIYELLYNIYMIIEKKVGFPLLYIIGKADLAKRSDTAVMLKDSSVDNAKSDAKYLNPDEPKGFQNLLDDLFKKIQICTSSVLLAADEIKVTSDISGVALKMLRSSVYERAQNDIREYDEVADAMFSVFKEGVSKELKQYSKWNLCKIRAEYEIWAPQSDTEFVSRLVIQKQSNIISGETATELSMDSQPDEIDRLRRELLVRQEEEKKAKETTTDIATDKAQEGGAPLADNTDNRLKTPTK